MKATVSSLLGLLLVGGCTSAASQDAGLDAQADSGALVCDVPTSIGIGGNCTVTLRNCTDGRVYQANCASPTTCDCRIQDEAGLTPGKQIPQNVCPLSKAEQLKAINEGCGWSIVSR